MHLTPFLSLLLTIIVTTTIALPSPSTTPSINRLEKRLQANWPNPLAKVREGVELPNLDQLVDQTRRFGDKFSSPPPEKKEGAEIPWGESIRLLRQAPAHFQRLRHQVRIQSEDIAANKKLFHEQDVWVDEKSRGCYVGNCVTKPKPGQTVPGLVVGSGELMEYPSEVSSISVHRYTFIYTYVYTLFWAREGKRRSSDIEERDRGNGATLARQNRKKAKTNRLGRSDSLQARKI